MTPKALAALHALCFTTPRPWREDEFSTLLETPGSFPVFHTNGFALGRIAGPEAELLTIAIHPDARNAGHGQRLIDAFLCGAATRGAREVFLEVATNNPAAIALYRKSGFHKVGERANYFKEIRGPARSALVFKYTF
ncbi:MAG: GNAT family N-acetyltransferase [Rhodobacteraceae bacterium]|nr:GNAT family N-acetyltransferase [Paracoccaceae bacterium]